MHSFLAITIDPDWFVRAWAITIFATSTLSAISAIRQDITPIIKCVWILIVLSIPIFGPLIYYIRFKT